MESEDDLKSLRQAVEALNSRVERLEQELAAKSLKAQATSLLRESPGTEAPALEAGGVPLPGVTQDPHPNPLQQTLNLKSIGSDPEAGEKEAEAPGVPAASRLDDGNPQESSLESKIGLYWLSRIGITFLVIGVASLILYSFQYFGSWAKLLTGFIVAGALIAAGEYADRKQGLRWYGNALAGGGWALAYFTTYAMHHVPDVRVVTNPITGSALMLAVAAGAIAHSLYKNSELIATLAISLGFITLGMTEIGPFSAGASAILSGALAYLVHKGKWSGLYVIGISIAFLFQFGCIDSQSAVDSSLKLAFVIPYWLAASLLPLSLPKESDRVNAATAAVAIIASICTFNSIHPSALAQFGKNADSILYAIGAVSYAALALTMKKFHCSTAALVDGLLALSSFALLVPALFDGPVVLISWAIQLALILWAGLTYNLRSFRWFAYPLSIVLFGETISEMGNKETFALANLNIPFSALNVLPSILVYSAATYAYQAERFKSTVSNTVRTVSFYWYFHLAALLAFVLIPLLVYGENSGLKELGTGFLTFGWALESLALGLLALKWRRKYLTAISIFGLLACISSSLIAENHQHVVPSILALGIAYTLAFKSRTAPSEMRPHILFGTYFVIASFWLFVFQAAQLPSADYTAAALSAETLAFILLGKHTKEVVIRTMGVLAATILQFVLLFENHLTWYSILPSIAALFAAGHLYKHLRFEDGLDNTRQIVRHYFNIGATLALTCFVGWHLQSYFVSCVWAVEALLLLAAGFQLKDKPLRICGLSVFALVIGRLLIFDLASAETIYRIVAFIVAGLMLMLAAYAYSWFSKKIKQ